MAWSVDFDSKLGIIIAHYSGRVTADDFKEAANQTLAMAIKNKTNKLLIDDSKLESAVSMSDIYEMPEYYDEVKAPRISRWALILPPSGKIREKVNFYELVCRNRGWCVRSFENRQEAIEWLTR